MGPVFEGMPFVRYSEQPIDWIKISKDVLNMFAPKIPFKYLSEEKKTIYKDRE